MLHGAGAEGQRNSRRLVYQYASFSINRSIQICDGDISRRLIGLTKLLVQSAQKFPLFRNTSRTEN